MKVVGMTISVLFILIYIKFNLIYILDKAIFLLKFEIKKKKTSHTNSLIYRNYLSPCICYAMPQYNIMIINKDIIT